MTMPRHRTLTILVALLTITAFVAPASAQVGGLLGTGDQSPEIQTYDGNPSVIVQYENGSTAPTALQDWANSTDQRQLVSLDNNTKEAVVAAPRDQLLQRTILGVTLPALFSDPLETRGYVERVDLNYRIERTPPVSNPLAESEFEPQTVRPFGLFDPEFPTEGLAFSGDVNATTLNVSRSATAVDQVSADGTGQTVAVIDTGANTAGGSLFSNGSAVGGVTRIDNASKSFITNRSVNATAGNYSAIEDGNGHGTWVASAIAANASGDTYDGMAPNASLLVLKALADDGSGSTSDIADAIRYAADNDADIISASLGSPVYSQPLVAAIDYAYDNGVQAVVVAAGNSRPTRSPGVASPGDYPPVITVGATNGSAPADAWSAYFSQVGPDSGAADLSEGATRGAGVDVAAPGFQVTAKTASTSGALSNETLSGTSMATPIVSGVLAAAMDANSTLAGLNHTDIHDRVRNSSEPVPNAAEVEVGGGMVDADALANGNTNDTSQADAMTAGALQRDSYYTTLGEPEGFLGISLGVLVVFGSLRRWRW